MFVIAFTTIFVTNCKNNEKIINSEKFCDTIHKILNQGVIMKQLKFIGSAFAVAVAMTLTACGGGGSDNGGNVGNNPQPPVTSTPTTLTDAQVLTDLKITNIDELPGGNGRAPGTWRWATTPDQPLLVYIPVPSNTVEQDLANKVNVAISTYNSKLGAYVTLQAVNTMPTTTTNFIQIGYNSSWIPPGSTDYNSYCSNVSDVYGAGSTMNPTVRNTIENPIYVNLGNNHCAVTQDIVNHEFGHALGMGVHFDVFGNTKSPDNFWDVLATLYGNPIATTSDKIVIKRAAK